MAGPFFVDSKTIEQVLRMQEIARNMAKSGMLEPTFQRTLATFVANPTILNVAIQQVEMQKLWSAQQISEMTSVINTLAKGLGNLSTEKIKRVASASAEVIEPFLREKVVETNNNGRLSAPIHVTASFDVERIVTKSEQFHCDVQRIIVNRNTPTSPLAVADEIQDWLLLIGKDLRTTVKGTLAPLVTFFAALANMLNTRGQLEESNVAITVAAVFLLIALTNPQNK